MAFAQPRSLFSAIILGVIVGLDILLGWQEHANSDAHVVDVLQEMKGQMLQGRMPATPNTKHEHASQTHDLLRNIDVSFSYVFPKGDRTNCNIFRQNLDTVLSWGHLRGGPAVKVTVFTTAKGRLVAEECVEQRAVTVVSRAFQDPFMVAHAYKRRWVELVDETHAPTTFVYAEHDSQLTWAFMQSWARDTMLLAKFDFLRRGFIRSCVRFETCHGQEFLLDQTKGGGKLPDLNGNNEVLGIIKIGSRFFQSLEEPYCAVAILTADQARRWVHHPQFQDKTMITASGATLESRETAVNGHIFASQGFTLQGNKGTTFSHRALVPLNRDGSLGGKVHHGMDKYCDMNRLPDGQENPFGKVQVPYYSANVNLVSGPGRYFSSAWEQLWLDNIAIWQNGKICSALAEQQQQLKAFMNATCTARTDTEWCLIDDSVQPMWYDTQRGALQMTKPASIAHVTKLSKVVPDDPAVFSHFEWPGGRVEYIEPLVSHLRHPMAGCSEPLKESGEALVGNDTLTFSIFHDLDNELLANRGYIVPPPGVGTLAREFHYFDAGASAWFTGDGGPSLSYFTTIWERHGIDFDHIEAWEGSTPPKTFWKSVPSKYRNRTSYHQQWIASAPDETPFLPTVIRESTKKKDYVLLKLDIDNGPVEKGTVDHLLADDNSDIEWIDEFLWEHHVDNYFMNRFWGILPKVSTVDASLSLADSYQYFLRLRRKGVRAHAWV